MATLFIYYVSYIFTFLGYMKGGVSKIDSAWAIANSIYTSHTKFEAVKTCADILIY